MHSFSSASVSLRFLHRIQLSKWLSNRHTSFLLNSEAVKPLGPSSRIICTDSKRQLAHNHQYQSLANQAIDSTALACPIALLKDITRLPDSPCVKLITLPSEYQALAGPLFESRSLPSEYKALAGPGFESRSGHFNKAAAINKSLFFYDVRLTEVSENYLPFSGVYFYSYEDIHDSSIYHAKSRNLPWDVGEVWMAGSSGAKENDTGRPTEDQLLKVIDRLTQGLLFFFERRPDFRLYHKNIVFQNNIKGVTIKGRNAYIQAMYLFRFYGYVQYARVKVEILKITHHVEDGSIRVRWRVNSVPRHKVLLKLWKLRSMTWQQFVQEEAEWLDGFSVFSVGTDGLIYKHICDKMTPNDDTVTTKKVDLKSRLLGLFDMGPRGGPAAGSLNALMPCQEYASSGKKLT